MRRISTWSSPSPKVATTIELAIASSSWSKPPSPTAAGSVATR